MKTSKNEEAGINIAVLAGNGLSIACNENLKLEAITENVLAAWENEEGPNAVQHIFNLAERTTEKNKGQQPDFEELVDSFGALSVTLKMLQSLAEDEAENESGRRLHDSLQVLSDLLTRYRDDGISHVLEWISTESTISKANREDLDRLVAKIIQATSGKVVFGNLNYDTVLLASVLTVCKKKRIKIADLGEGGDGKPFQMKLGSNKEFEFLPLRTEPDFPHWARIRLLNLHGSLTYWRSGDGNQFGKLRRKGDLNKIRPWKAIRSGETQARPVVVLSNRKDKRSRVEEYPFSLAYKSFSDDLICSRIWLIMGYSFRDVPVNRMLRGALKRFFKKYGRFPAIFVVTQGKVPENSDIRRALNVVDEYGIYIPKFEVFRDGAFEFTNSEQFENVCKLVHEL